MRIATALAPIATVLVTLVFYLEHNGATGAAPSRSMLARLRAAGRRLGASIWILTVWALGMEAWGLRSGFSTIWWLVAVAVTIVALAVMALRRSEPPWLRPEHNGPRHEQHARR
jgi:hypothetical protein